MAKKRFKHNMPQLWAWEILVESERADAAVAQGREKPAFSAMEINTKHFFRAPVPQLSLFPKQFGNKWQYHLSKSQFTAARYGGWKAGYLFRVTFSTARAAAANPFLKL